MKLRKQIVYAFFLNSAVLAIHAMENKHVTEILITKNLVHAKVYYMKEKTGELQYFANNPTKIWTSSGCEQENLYLNKYKKLTELCPAKDENDLNNSWYELEIIFEDEDQDSLKNLTKSKCWKINSGAFGEGEFQLCDKYSDELNECVKILTEDEE